MEVSENNGGEGSSDKEEGSYNLSVVRPNDQVVPPPPPPPLLGSVYVPPSFYASPDVRPTRPLSEQLGLTHDTPHLVPQQVTASSSSNSEIERHSLNTGSSNSYGGMQETHSSASIILSEVSSNSPSIDTDNVNSATGNSHRPKGGAKGSVTFPDNNHSIEDVECDSPAQNSDPFDLLCFQCGKEHKDMTLLPCRELCVCSNCAKFLKATEGLCPSCNNRVDDIFTSKLPTRIKPY